jgi:suppressor for copper-sensitivity B
MRFNFKKYIIILFSILFYSLLNSSICLSNSLVQNNNFITNQKYDFVKIKLLNVIKYDGANPTILLGLKVTLSPGWKIYWRNPGDAGLPPEIKWSNTNKIQSLKLLFPSPIRFDFYGIETFGYENEVIFPMEIVNLGNNKTLSGNLDFSAQVCSKICVPVNKLFDLSRIDYNYENASILKEITRYKSMVPILAQDKELKLLSYNFQDKKLNLVFDKKFTFKVNDIIIEDSKDRVYPKPFFTTENQLMNISIDTKDIKNEDLNNQKLHLTFINDKSSFKKSITTTNLLTSNLISDTHNIAIIFGFKILLVAFIGGFILNFMPCVLPVLSLKMIQLINYRDQNQFNFRLKIFFNIFGILTTFICLAIGTYFIKTAGDMVGWGVQFQSEYFLIFMITLTLIFSLNLFGIFQFYLPSKFLSILSYRTNGFAGDFLTGMFMTLLATPCTAPFVGTAIGFALAGTTFEIFTIFIVMGFGLSFPLIIFSLFPNIISFIPKPGNWFVLFKKLMALLLLGTAIWLTSILVKLNSDFFYSSKSNIDNQITSNWDITNNIELPNQLARQGKIVFIDITADWCLTCKVNKFLVTDTMDVKELFQKHKVTVLRLDWTKPNYEIKRFLSRKGRYGIPFNEIYGPSLPNGKIFPELLNQNTIKEYITLAK